MSAPGIVAIMLVAGACHAGWNLVAKRVHTDRTLLLMAASAVIVVALAPWGLTHLPDRSIAIGVGCVVLRGILNVLYLVGLSRSYQVFDLSLAYPLVRGTGPVVATVLAIWLLGERPALVGLIGVALVSLAILMMAVAAGSSTRRSGARVPLRGFGVVLFTGVTIGAYTVVDKVGVRYWDPVAYLWGVEVTGFTVISIYLLYRHRVRELADVVVGHWRNVAICAALIAASYVLALFALQHSLASYIAPMREVSVLFGAILGMVVLKEDHGTKRVMSAGAIAVGLILVGIAL